MSWILEHYDMNLYVWRGASPVQYFFSRLQLLIVLPSSSRHVNRPGLDFVDLRDRPGMQKERDYQEFFHLIRVLHPRSFFIDNFNENFFFFVILICTGEERGSFVKNYFWNLSLVNFYAIKCNLQQVMPENMLLVLFLINKWIFNSWEFFLSVYDFICIFL